MSGSLAVEVTADNGVVVHFAHASPAVDDRTISKDQLEATYFQEIQVWDQTDRNLVQLSSECKTRGRAVTRSTCVGGGRTTT
ncbi:MAG: hypothetical protein U0263_39025 [Polyangiaceae bacterium]